MSSFWVAFYRQDREGRIPTCLPGLGAKVTLLHSKTIPLCLVANFRLQSCSPRVVTGQHLIKWEKLNIWWSVFAYLIFLLSEIDPQAWAFWCITPQRQWEVKLQIEGAWSAVFWQHGCLVGLWSTAHCTVLQSPVVHTAHCTHCTLHNAQSCSHTAHCTLHTAHYTLHSPEINRSTQCTLHCKLYTVKTAHYTLYIAQLCSHQ